jgi:hypothetical protein
VQWLIVSLGLSLILTLVANIALRVFPDLGPWVARRLASLTQPDERIASTRRTRARVIVPWKAMIVVSVVLTVLFNILRLIH